MSKIEKAIKELEQIKKEPDCRRWLGTIALECIDTAIEALQEKLERDKGCEYCNNGKALVLNKYEDVSLEIDKYGLSVFDGNKCITVGEANCCPMCGKKLERR